jgi:hypothetical protein
MTDQPRYLAVKVLDSSDETGYCIADTRLGFAELGPPDMSKAEALAAADRLNQEAEKA